MVDDDDDDDDDNDDNDDDDDDNEVDDDLSGCLLCPATSRAALGSVWVLGFHYSWYSPTGNSLLASIRRLL